MPYNLENYLPIFYNGIQEIDALMDTENTALDEFKTNLDEIFGNQFVQSATSSGLTYFEDILGITPNLGTETLQFRRDRVLNRLATNPPFSLPFLKQKLNDIIGINKWALNMDYNNYTLTIESSATDQQWNHEIAVTMNKIKPANIIFINKPTLYESIIISEEVGYDEINYNYKVGTTWVLGAAPFTTVVDKGVIKLAADGSIQDALLDNVATFTETEINNIIINDTYVISSFTTKSVTDNVVTVEYDLPVSSGITEVTNIKMRRSDNTVLTSATVYVPIVTDITLKHTIEVKEGD